MSQFQNQSYFKKIIYSPITLVVLAVIVFIAVYGVIDIIPKYRDALQAERAIENKKEVLIEREKKLTDELNKLQTQEGIEESIRENLNVVKEGEHVIMIVEPKATQTLEVEQKEKTFWQRLFE